MNIHELGGLAPTAYICESISPLALHTLTAGGGGCQIELVPVSTTWEAGGYPSDYCRGHVRMLGCLLGQLRGCLNVVTGTGESDCCVTGCSCNSGGGCHPLFLCSSVQRLGVVWQCEMCACHLQ